MEIELLHLLIIQSALCNHKRMKYQDVVVNVQVFVVDMVC